MKIKDVTAQIIADAKANGLAVDVEAFVKNWLTALCKGSSPEQFLLEAEVNQVRDELVRLQDRVARDVETWADYRLTGDLFDEFPPIRAPKTIMVDGAIRPIHQCSLAEVEQYVEYLLKLSETSVSATKTVLRLRQATHDARAAQLETIKEAVDVCRSRGVDPSTVRFSTR
jgi:hypothetical protein